MRIPLRLTGFLDLCRLVARPLRPQRQRPAYPRAAAGPVGSVWQRKTAAFALPILDRLARAPAARSGVRALVLTPTRELAAQVAASFRRYGQYLRFRCATVFGGVGQEPQVQGSGAAATPTSRSAPWTRRTAGSRSRRGSAPLVLLPMQPGAYLNDQKKAILEGVVSEEDGGGPEGGRRRRQGHARRAAYDAAEVGDRPFA